MNSEIQEGARDSAMREAALAYERFLVNNPEERTTMEEWEAAPLVDSIEPDKA